MAVFNATAFAVIEPSLLWPFCSESTNILPIRTHLRWVHGWLNLLDIVALMMCSLCFANSTWLWLLWFWCWLKGFHIIFFTLRWCCCISLREKCDHCNCRRHQERRKTPFIEIARTKQNARNITKELTQNGLNCNSWIRVRSRTSKQDKHMQMCNGLNKKMRNDCWVFGGICKKFGIQISQPNKKQQIPIEFTFRVFILGWVDVRPKVFWCFHCQRYRCRCVALRATCP